MCGRFTIISEEEAIERRFGASFAEPGTFEPRYNAAPSAWLPVVLSTHPHEVRMARWGLTPPWAKKMGRKDGIINVKAETLRDKKTFAEHLRTRRLLVLADGFYEWRSPPAGGRGPKTPFRFQLTTGELFAMAGIWEETETEGGSEIRFAIITTEPNPLVSAVHDRMPVLLAKEREGEWLAAKTREAALDALGTFPADRMKTYQVSTRVNRATHDSPELVEPAERAPKQGLGL